MPGCRYTKEGSEWQKLNNGKNTREQSAGVTEDAKYGEHSSLEQQLRHILLTDLDLTLGQQIEQDV